MTLIEVMIAMAILAMALSVLFSGLLSARNTRNMAEDVALAYQQIQAQIETYQYLPFKTVETDFKGAKFDVPGLIAPTGRTSVGTISSVYNANPYNATVGATNPNIFGTSFSEIPLRFRCEWTENNSTMSVEVVYVLVYRGL